MAFCSWSGLCRFILRPYFSIWFHLLCLLMYSLGFKKQTISPSWYLNYRVSMSLSTQVPVSCSFPNATQEAWKKYPICSILGQQNHLTNTLLKNLQATFSSLQENGGTGQKAVKLFNAAKHIYHRNTQRIKLLHILLSFFPLVL